MANNTISQVEINGTTYDLLDANTLSAVSDLREDVTTLQNSVDILNNSLIWIGQGAASTRAFNFFESNGNLYLDFRLGDNEQNYRRIIFTNTSVQYETHTPSDGTINWTTNSFTTKRFNKSNVTISANGYARIDINVSLSGYTPIGVLGWSGSASQGDEYAGRFNVEGNTLTFIIFNKATSAKTDNFSFDVLYKKA